MRETCASTVWLVLLLGCDSSRKKPPPPEPAKVVEASAPARDAGVARDAGATRDAGVASPPAPDLGTARSSSCFRQSPSTYDSACRACRGEVMIWAMRAQRAS